MQGHFYNPGGLVEPKAALSPSGSRGLGLLPLKKEKDSNGDLSKEELTWPLDLAPVQRVSEHLGCFGGLSVGGIWCQDPHLFPFGLLLCSVPEQFSDGCNTHQYNILIFKFLLLMIPQQ